VGVNPVADICVVKIDEGNDWPFAHLGLSQEMVSGDRCVIAGYPDNHDGEKPLIRESKVIAPDDYVWSSLLLTAVTSNIRSGDSGGGIFNERGEFVAIHLGKGGDVGRHRRAEVLLLQWHDLVNQSPVNPAKATSR
jgi:S1-C subfamily serine protease